MNRVLIVGEAPGAGRRDGRTRSRISDLAGRPWDEWADWANLLDAWPGDSGRKGSAWNARAAREAASRLNVSGYEAVVLLGRRVAGVMLPGGAGFPFFRWTPLGPTAAQTTPVVVIPHTSGVVRWWNEPENVERARAFLSSLAETALADRSETGGSARDGSVGNGPADDSPKEEKMSGKTATTSKSNRRVGPKEAQNRQQREAQAEASKPKPPAKSMDSNVANDAAAARAQEPTDAAALYDALIERAKNEIDGVKLIAKKNKQHRYTAVMVGGKNVGYVALGKKSVAVQIRKGQNAGTTKVKAESQFAAAIKALSSTAAAISKEQAEGRETVKV